MFRFAFFALLVLSMPLSAKNLKWGDLVESRTYKVDREISLNHHKSGFTIKAGQELRLLDFRPLPMINVFLAEFQLANCPMPAFVSEMILVHVDQGSGKKPVSVGVDMGEKCVLELYLEKKDYNAQSIFR